MGLVNAYVTPNEGTTFGLVRKSGEVPIGVTEAYNHYSRGAKVVVKGGVGRQGRKVIHERLRFGMTGSEAMSDSDSETQIIDGAGQSRGQKRPAPATPAHQQPSKVRIATIGERSRGATNPVIKPLGRQLMPQLESVADQVDANPPPQPQLEPEAEKLDAKALLSGACEYFNNIAPLTSGVEDGVDTPHHKTMPCLYDNTQSDTYNMACAYTVMFMVEGGREYLMQNCPPPKPSSKFGSPYQKDQHLDYVLNMAPADFKNYILNDAVFKKVLPTEKAAMESTTDRARGWMNTVAENVSAGKDEYPQKVSKAATEEDKKKCRCVMCGCYMRVVGKAVDKGYQCSHFVELDHSLPKAHVVRMYLMMLRSAVGVARKELYTEDAFKQWVRNIGGAKAHIAGSFIMICTMCNQVKSDMIPYRLEGDRSARVLTANTACYNAFYDNLKSMVRRHVVGISDGPSGGDTSSSCGVVKSNKCLTEWVYSWLNTYGLGCQVAEKCTLAKDPTLHMFATDPFVKHLEELGSGDSFNQIWDDTVMGDKGYVGYHALNVAKLGRVRKLGSRYHLLMQRLLEEITNKKKVDISNPEGRPIMSSWNVGGYGLPYARSRDGPIFQHLPGVGQTFEVNERVLVDITESTIKSWNVHLPERDHWEPALFEGWYDARVIAIYTPDGQKQVSTAGLATYMPPAKGEIAVQIITEGWDRLQIHTSHTRKNGDGSGLNVVTTGLKNVVKVDSLIGRAVKGASANTSFGYRAKTSLIGEVTRKLSKFGITYRSTGFIKNGRSIGWHDAYNAYKA